MHIPQEHGPVAAYRVALQICLFCRLETISPVPAWFGNLSHASIRLLEVDDFRQELKVTESTNVTTIQAPIKRPAAIREAELVQRGAEDFGDFSKVAWKGEPLQKSLEGSHGLRKGFPKRPCVFCLLYIFRGDQNTMSRKRESLGMCLESPDSPGNCIPCTKYLGIRCCWIYDLRLVPESLTRAFIPPPLVNMSIRHSIFSGPLTKPLPTIGRVVDAPSVDAAQASETPSFKTIDEWIASSDVDFHQSAANAIIHYVGFKSDLGTPDGALARSRLIRLRDRIVKAIKPSATTSELAVYEKILADLIHCHFKAGGSHIELPLSVFETCEGQQIVNRLPTLRELRHSVIKNALESTARQRTQRGYLGCVGEILGQDSTDVVSYFDDILSTWDQSRIDRRTNIQATALVEQRLRAYPYLGSPMGEQAWAAHSTILERLDKDLKRLRSDTGQDDTTAIKATEEMIDDLKKTQQVVERLRAIAEEKKREREKKKREKDENRAQGRGPLKGPGKAESVAGSRRKAPSRKNTGR